MLDDLLKRCAGLPRSIGRTTSTTGLAGAGSGLPALPQSTAPVRNSAKPVPASATPTGDSDLRVSRHENASVTWATERLPDGRYAALLKPPMPPRQAAHELAAWLRQVGELGEHSPRKLLALYAELAELERRSPVPDNMLLAALKGVPGVRKVLATGVRKAGKRHRPTLWVIEPVSEAIGEDAA